MSGENGTLHLRIKVIPRAGVTGIRGRMADNTVKIALRAPPANGRANAELIKFLAGEFGTRSSSVTILSGISSRKKLISVISYSKIPDWFREQSS
ncbi:MAG: DUF167 domain-containing protein [Candidatus Fermentibacteria bacterium]